jgi:hypothetical protein
MAEYIDLDTPLEVKVARGNTYKPYTSTLRELLDVNHIPYTAADVEEKRTGKWVKVSYVERSAFGRAIWHKTFQCSRCGGLFGREDDKYCYNCGAYMRGDCDG